MLLIRPKSDARLSFTNSVQHIREGYRAAAKALDIRYIHRAAKRDLPAQSAWS